MKLLVFFVFSVLLALSWAQQPAAYGVPPKDQGPKDDQFGPGFHPRGLRNHGRDSNNRPDSNLPPNPEANLGPRNLEAGGPDKMPLFGSPKSSAMQPGSTAF